MVVFQAATSVSVRENQMIIQSKGFRGLSEFIRASAMEMVK